MTNDSNPTNPSNPRAVGAESINHCPVFPASNLAALDMLVPRAVLGVFGNPIVHSLSPIFQNAALQAAGIDGQFIRLLAETPEEFVLAARALHHAGFMGANVTIPFKPAALEAVEDCGDIDPFARAAGGVNTLVVRDGRLLGYNTDGYGLSQAVREEFGISLGEARVLILGAGGGAGRGAAAQCALENCPAIFLHNRTPQKIIAPPNAQIAETPESVLDRVDLVINATSLGLRPDDPVPLDTSRLTNRHAVFDMVYMPTRLVHEAQLNGAQAANGLSMLLHQGACSFELWFERPAPIDAMRAALLMGH